MRYTAKEYICRGKTLPSQRGTPRSFSFDFELIPRISWHQRRTTPMIKPPNALLHGTLDALILKTLTGGPRHGYAIAKLIEEASGETVVIEEGSLYPALYRMERRGWLEAEWGESELGRRAKMY